MSGGREGGEKIVGEECKGDENGGGIEVGERM